MTARWQQSEASRPAFAKFKVPNLKSTHAYRVATITWWRCYIRDRSIHPSIHPSSKDELLLFVIRAKVIQKKKKKIRRERERERIEREKKKSPNDTTFQETRFSPRSSPLFDFLSTLFATSPWKTLWYLVKNSVKSWS